MNPTGLDPFGKILLGLNKVAQRSESGHAMTAESELYAEEYGAGPPLILLHGLMTSSEMFAAFAQRLATWFRVIVPDLRGHGRSAHLAPPDSIQQMAADLLPLLAARGIDTADFLGYSLGGAVAQQFALDNPHRVRRLVLIATAASDHDRLIDRVESTLIPPALRVLGPAVAAYLLMVVPGVGGGPRLPRATLAKVRGMLASSDRDQMVAVTRAMRTFDIRDRLHELMMPTLVIAGGDDWSAPVRQSEVLAQGIPNAKLVVMPHAGHTLIWTHERALIEIIAPWLGVAESPRAA